MEVLEGKFGGGWESVGERMEEMMESNLEMRRSSVGGEGVKKGGGV